MVDLGNETTKSARSDIDLLAIIGSTSSVDIETCQDFTDGLVDSKDDLALSQ